MQRALQLRTDPIDHRAADDGLADARACLPRLPVAEQIVDHDTQVVIGGQQPGTCSYDPVPVMVGVATEGDVESIPHADQALHCIGGGGVHADLAVPVERHEPKRGIDLHADDVKFKSVVLGDAGPVVHARPAQGIDAQAQRRRADGLHVDDGAQVRDIGADIIVQVRGCGASR